MGVSVKIVTGWQNFNVRWPMEPKLTLRDDLSPEPKLVMLLCDSLSSS